MAIQAVGPLNHYLTEDLSANVTRLNRKALAANVLEKICWVAFLAIVGVIFAVSYAGITLTGSLPLVMVGLALSGPLFGLAASHLNIRTRAFSQQAEGEQKVLDKLGEISGWEEGEVRQFFLQQHLDITKLPLRPLQQKEPERPHKALLPLIARFMYMQELSEKAEEMAQRNLHLEPQQSIEETQKRILRLTSRQIGWKQHEHEAIPRALEAALLLQEIENPQMDVSLNDLGTFRAKSFEERMFNRDFPPVSDEYFVFHPANRRLPLTLQGIEEDMSPSTLRGKLFPQPIRA